MKIVYTPTGAEPIEYDWLPFQLQIPEVALIERQTGKIFEQWRQDVERGSMLDIWAFLWVMQKREQPKLRIDQVVFTPSEIDFSLDDDETRNVVAGLRYRIDSEDLTPGERMNLEQTIESLEAAIEKPLDDDDEATPTEPVEPGPVPKAP